MSTPVPRISRDHLTDAALTRARSVLNAHLTTLNVLRHRAHALDETETATSLRLDEDALTDVATVLLIEQQQRSVDARELSRPAEQIT